MTDHKDKPALDEQTFEKLLEAAYVLQEHNREMRQMEESLELHSEQLRQQEAKSVGGSRPPEETKPADADYTLTLAEIVEAQHQIQIRHLDCEKAMAVVAERIARITRASGAGIGILEGKNIRYQAGAGDPALPLGSEVPLETAICAACVRTGQVLRTPDVNMEFLFDPELCRSRKIQSLCAVPIYHDGNIVGALELYFDRPQGYAEQDIHTCQLMAGLVTEAIGRASESTLKKSMAAERSSMLAAIEILKPNLVAMAEQKTPEEKTVAGNKSGTVSEHVAALSAAEDVTCWKCAAKLLGDEQFCGKCGAPRMSAEDAATFSSKFPSTLDWPPPSHSLPPANGTRPSALTANRSTSNSNGDGLAGSSSRLDKDKDNDQKEAWKSELELRSSLVGTKEEAASDFSSLSPSDAAEQNNMAGSWSSAAKARDFLESLHGSDSSNALVRFWRARRGDFYLAMAVILVGIVIRWGILSERPVGATGGTSTAARHKTIAPDANLSTFDKLLISLGLAEPPEETPEYKGTPGVQVWIDTRTALYYCPGSELYGNTPKGRFATQRDAQLDQFESASRKACD